MKVLLLFFFFMVLGSEFLYFKGRKPTPIQIIWTASESSEPRLFIIDSLQETKYEGRVNLWYKGKNLGSVDLNALEQLTHE